MADVFISYKKENRAVAQLVEAALIREGISVWWDTSLNPRESWDAIIQREIADAAAVIVVWTPPSVQSEWVRIEANYGKVNGKLVPLLVEPCSIPLAFSLTQTAMLSDWDGAADHEGWRQALGWITALMNKDQDHDSLPQTQPSTFEQSHAPLPLVGDGAASKMWGSIENSLDPRDYEDFCTHFSNSKLTFEASRRMRQLQDWAQVDQSSAQAIAQFRSESTDRAPLFRALEAFTEKTMRRAADRNFKAGREVAGDLKDRRARRLAYGAACAAFIATCAGALYYFNGLDVRSPSTNGASENAIPPRISSNSNVVTATGANSENSTGQTFRDKLLDGGQGPEMVVLPAGSFLMGSPGDELDRDEDEKLPRTVNIEKAFAIGKFEVTWAEWEACVDDKACMGIGPESAGGDNDWRKGNRPVIEVSRNDALVYLSWLSAKTGQEYRLPTEAEWEYAARGGNSDRFSWGNDAPVCEFRARNGAVFNECDLDGTQPVGFSKANPFGLHDVHGNVWEWTQDCYGETNTLNTIEGNEAPLSECTVYVLRGGSHVSDAQGIRSANRWKNAPEFRENHIGFRVVRVL